MTRTMTWADLEGANALEVVGTVAGLLKQLERACRPSHLDGLTDRYRTEALSGDYENVLDVSHRYAYEHLRTTLDVPEER
jgi:hypothetical protein